MTYKPCRVTFETTRYAIDGAGNVTALVSDSGDWEWVAAERAALVRAHASRLRQNRNSRERYQAMRDLGMVKTPYGWE